MGETLAPDAPDSPATWSLKRPRHRFAQVLRTYPRRWHFYVCLGVLLNYLLLLPTQHKKIHMDGMIITLLMFMFVVVAAITMAMIEHLKEQFADWRPRLYPGFMVPHLAVGAILLLSAILLVPLRTSVGLGLGFLPLLAISATAAATIGWAGYLPALRTLLPIIFLACSFASEDVRDACMQMLKGERLSLAWWIIGTDAFALLTLLYRLATLHEGRREFARAMPNWDLRAAMTGDPSTRALPSGGTRDPLPMILMRYTDRSVLGSPRIHNTGFRWRVRHWRMVTLNGWKARSLGIATTLIVLFMLAIIIFTQKHPWQSVGAAIGILMLAIILAPPLIVGIAWPRRWMTIAHEASLPLTRRSLIRQLGVAMMLDHFAVCLWGMLSAALITTIVAAAVNVAWIDSSTQQNVQAIPYVELAPINVQTTDAAWKQKLQDLQAARDELTLDASKYERANAAFLQTSAEFQTWAKVNQTELPHVQSLQTTGAVMRVATDRGWNAGMYETVPVAGWLTPSWLGILPAATVLQILPFGIIVWAMRFRSGIVSLLILFPTCAAALAPMILAPLAYTYAGYVGVVQMMLAFVITGVLLALNSYFWWLRADLE